MNAYAPSTAVMARRLEPADSLDFFPTPPWGTRALMEHVLPQVWPYPDLFNCVAFDPCCGEGHMAVALGERFAGVHAADIFSYGFGAVSDFLHPEPAFLPEADWIVMNPPFNLGLGFVERALGQARRGVAVLVRTAFCEGAERYRRLFRGRPPQVEAQFVERLAMHKGRWVVNGTTATAYCWMVWLTHVPHGWGATRRIWIPPCKTKLTRHDDWLRFGGCEDLPKDHAVMKEIERRKATAGERFSATVADIRAAIEGML
jgi:hypothetical protein